MRIAHRLDQLGVHYIEGGWPGSNPKDLRFFKRVQDAVFKSAKISAFGATRRPGVRPQEDAQPPGARRGGPARRHHLRQGVGLPRDLRAGHHARREPGDDRATRSRISSSTSRRSSTTPSTSSTATSATRTTRCGRCWPRRPRAPTASCSATPTAGACRRKRPPSSSEVKRAVKGGDAARHPRAQRHRVRGGDVAGRGRRAAIGHVQGTINGYGERCGNANLVSIIPNLMLKMGLGVHPAAEPARAARRLPPRLRAGQPQAVVGPALRGRLRVRPQGRHPRLRGAQASRDLRARRTRRRSATSAACSSPSWPGSPTCSGRRKEYGIDLDKNTPEARRILEMLKRLEDEGFLFEGAEASFELLMERALGNHRPYFELAGLSRDRGGGRGRRRAGGGGHRAPAREGHRGAHRRVRQRTGARARPRAPQGPRGLLPEPAARWRCSTTRCASSTSRKATAAKTRVLITSGDGDETWGTVGVADNIIEASWQALVDSVEYKLRRDEQAGQALSHPGHPAKLIEDTARELTARAAIDIPFDYREGVRLARDREQNRLARFVLDQMLGNWDIASADRRPMCADTGLPRYYVRARQRGGGRGRAGGARARAPAGDRGGHPGDSPPPQPRPPAHPGGPQRQRGPPRPRGHLRGGAARGLDRRDHRAQGRALRQRLPDAVPRRRRGRHQALLRGYADRVGQAGPGLPARDRRRGHRRGQGHLRAARQGSGVPAHGRQPQSGSGRGARWRTS